MVHVGEKEESLRRAVAHAAITLSPQAYALLRQGALAKGDALGVARVAGIMAAKKTDALIPLCHPLPITGVQVEFAFDDTRCRVEIEGSVSVTGRTGVEMEALTAVSVAALTIYDMCKAVDKTMLISDIYLVRKSGGRSGDFVSSFPE